MKENRTPVHRQNPSRQLGNNVPHGWGIGAKQSLQYSFTTPYWKKHDQIAMYRTRGLRSDDQTHLSKPQNQGSSLPHYQRRWRYPLLLLEVFNLSCLTGVPCGEAANTCDVTFTAEYSPRNRIGTNLQQRDWERTAIAHQSRVTELVREGVDYAPEDSGCRTVQGRDRTEFGFLLHANFKLRSGEEERIQKVRVDRAPETVAGLPVERSLNPKGADWDLRHQRPNLRQVAWLQWEELLQELHYEVQDNVWEVGCD